MQWLLHVGTTKTGSKAIQQFLVNDAETLNGPRVVFPRTGRSGGIWHEELFYALAAGRTDLLAAARKEALLAQADYAVLSYEGFYQLPPESIALIKDTLGPARVLLFIRRQDSHANSWYNQLIKAHRVTIAAIDEFERNVAMFDPMFDHAATIEKWSAVFGAEAIPLLQRYIERNLESARRAVKAGVRLGMGSDAVFSMFGQNTRELGWFVKAGMTPEQALRSATIIPAELLGQQDRLGRAQPGFLADLIAVDGDPLARIDALFDTQRGVKWVMKDGQVVVDRIKQ